MGATEIASADGTTPLYIAAFFGYINIVKVVFRSNRSICRITDS